MVAYYEYDSWGKVVGIYDANNKAITSSEHIGKINPIRYRGYYYDEETEFYYLMSRYYDTNTYRFINSDAMIFSGEEIIGYNMYAYCNNNQIINIDLTGESCYSIIKRTTEIINGICEVIKDAGCLPPKSFKYDDSKNQNCYSYAFGLNEANNPGGLSVSESDPSCMDISKQSKYTPSEIAHYVLRDMKALHIPVRVISSPSDIIENEYVVAMKTSTIVKPEGYADYHFAILLEEGIWADKPGKAHSRYLIIDGNANTWDNGDWKNYYNTETVYFAVGR